eukprot:CAMPEP_0181237056 /NCGR_PEP_ID=MMETSP1096-20121128/38539_1 /TAXON_ID=156174 ORGANISM="Chrysochromulina ericina, Strain CCMP281" /NCGR_SAMPLE_ID=MMETSP1096 /ASSEMBLY_ACC=CAM_ASM_000453 /LENGTH=46 /DNA_ID= /DNA_START= /DNA_END= /DNA_ORIENTATION=
MALRAHYSPTQTDIVCGAASRGVRGVPNSARSTATTVRTSVDGNRE